MPARSRTDLGRQPLAAGADSRRSLDLELALRFPRIAAVLLRAAWGLLRTRSPRSRLRRLAVRIYARGGVEALNRGDLDVFLVFAHPEIEAVNTAEP